MNEPVDQHIEAARDAVRRRAWAPERVDGAFQDLVLRRRRDDEFRRRATRFGGGALAVAAAVALVVAGVRVLGPSDSPSATRTVTPGLERLVVADGTEVSFARTARVQVRERSDTRVVVTVDTGSAHFQVRHDPRRLFKVQAGDVEVEDLGTTFDVENMSGGVRVAVSEGSVAVSFPAEGNARRRATLGPGQSGIYAKGASPSVTARNPTDPAAEVTPESPRATGSGVPSVGWRELARGGKHGRAYELLAPGGFRDVRDEPGDLLLASDAARLSQHPAEAANLLRRLLAGHARDPRAPSAAFTLGWLLMKDLGKPREAAAAFARAESLAPRGNLAEDALARSVEAWQRAGDRSRAKAEVERYRKNYPGGRHLATLERLVGAP